MKENQRESDQRTGGQRGRLFTYSVDSFANGIAFGQQQVDSDAPLSDYFSLKLTDEGELVRLRSRYTLYQRNPLGDLERHLERLSKRGILRSSIIHFGTSGDPFLPFEGKFDASMKFLNLFTRYTPGMLVVQTRSPLVVIGMPVLTKLGKHASVTVPIETPLEDQVRRYTSGLPRIEDRLQAVRALRRFGIEVNLQVNPVLPYGDWKRDAGAFAQLLVEHGDHLFVRGLFDGTPGNDRRAKASALARRLAEDRKFQWLRYDTAHPLLDEIRVRAAEKLAPPQWKHLEEKQLGFFAA